MDNKKRRTHAVPFSTFIKYSTIKKVIDKEKHDVKK